MAEFDYSRLSPQFSKLSKPAQRALINAGIFTSKDLAKLTLRELKKLHGIGPSAIPILEKALKESGLAFKE